MPSCVGRGPPHTEKSGSLFTSSHPEHSGPNLPPNFCPLGIPSAVNSTFFPNPCTHTRPQKCKSVPYLGGTFLRAELPKGEKSCLRGSEFPVAGGDQSSGDCTVLYIPQLPASIISTQILPTTQSPPLGCPISHIATRGFFLNPCLSTPIRDIQDLPPAFSSSRT